MAICHDSLPMVRQVCNPLRRERVIKLDPMEDG